MFDAVKRMYRSTVFRLSIIAAALFVASSFLVLGYIYYATVTTQLQAVDDTMREELDEIQALYNSQGREAANREMIFRVTKPGSPNLYFYQQGSEFTTNMTSPARFENFDTPDKTIKFIRATSDGTEGFEEIHRNRAQIRDLSPDTRVLVGRDVELIMRAAERVQRALLIAMGIAATLGLVSGAYVSRRFARRIDDFNKLANDIRGGDFKRRAPKTESGDELDDLADHLNGMLDHIDRLMSAMRYAGDSIAHDLRSPLTRLRTTLESTATQVKDPQAQTALHDAADHASELLQTFESVLRIARLEAGDRRELLIPLDPKPIIDDLAELYEPSCEDAGLSFTCAIEGGTQIAADRGLLSQAVSNLLENAIKYTPEGGSISLGLRKTKNAQIEVWVADTGIGIPSEQRQRVKERFVRLEQSRSKPGTGLGLSLVQAVADLHRAHLLLADGPGPEGKPGLRASIIFPRVKR